MRGKQNMILISMGGNLSGAWGSPQATLERTAAELNLIFNGMTTNSSFFVTAPVGGDHQPLYVNAVLRVDASVGPIQLLWILQTLERRAGRRSGIGRRWGARALDLDVIDHGGRMSGWRVRGPRGDGGGHGDRPISARRPTRRTKSLILPHPLAHLRAFVLMPLLEVAPHWVHPVLHISGKTLLSRLPDRRFIKRL